MRRKKKLEIHYPDGCAEIESIIKAFQNVYGHEAKYEILLHKIENSKQFRRSGIAIKPFKVNHKDIHEDGSIIDVPSLGFKYIYDEKSICYGGDSAFSEELNKNTKGSNLAIIEAGALDESESELHMTLVQSMEIGETAKEYFLVHIPE